MDAHRHRYGLPAVTMLTLPDIDGYYDAVLLWQCQTCPHACHATGMVHQQSLGLTVEAWEQRVAEERATGSPIARMAAQQERRKVR